MAERINLEANHVTAGKFISVGKDSVSIKQKLKQTGQTISSNNSDLRMHFINMVASDGIYTPEEKKALKEELEYITAGFTTMKDNVESLGMDGSAEYAKFAVSYQKLTEALAPILADMDTNTVSDTNISSLMAAYTQYAATLNNAITTAQAGLQRKLTSYALKVVSSATDIKKGETIKLKAYIYVSDSDVTQDEMNKITVTDTEHPYPELFKWEFTGLADNEGMAEKALGNREVEISFDSMSGNLFSAVFSSDIECSFGV